MGLGRFSGLAFAFAFGFRRVNAAFSEVENLGDRRLEPAYLWQLFFRISDRSHEFSMADRIEYVHDWWFFGFDTKACFFDSE